MFYIRLRGSRTLGISLPLSSAANQISRKILDVVIKKLEICQKILSLHFFYRDSLLIVKERKNMHALWISRTSKICIQTLKYAIKYAKICYSDMVIALRRKTNQFKGTNQNKKNIFQVNQSNQGTFAYIYSYSLDWFYKLQTISNVVCNKLVHSSRSVFSLY